MKRVLLVFQVERIDIFGYLANDTTSTFSILWEKDKPVNSRSLPEFIKKEYFWNHYKNPDQLLNDSKPDLILFCEVLDTQQISLNIAAKARGIKTVFIDHGAASDPALAMERIKHEQKQNLRLKLNSLPAKIRTLFRNRWFYYYSFRYVSKENKWKFLSFPRITVLNNIVVASNRCDFSERKPDHFILFSKNNYKETDYTYHLIPETVFYSGVPFFDHYFRSKNEIRNHIIYIDHPYLEEGLFGWSKKHHRYIARSLEACAIKTGRRIYIKLHPRSSKDLWESYRLDPDHVTIKQFEDCTELYLSSAMILGFSSSLITGLLCAKKNIVMIGWNPDQKIKGFNPSERGLSHASYSPEDLNHKIDEWIENNLCLNNQPAFDTFIQDYNYPFDGKATERILRFLERV